jgi:hypothetical protein
MNKRFVTLSALVTALLSLSGCVERSITIVTDPPGSVVYLNDVEKGTTPLTTSFEWYGTYGIRIRGKKNIGTATEPKYQYYYLHTHRTTTRPWFQYYGLDLVASLLPIEFKDHKIWAFVVPPVKTLSKQQLIKNAQKLKSQLNADVKPH